MGTIIKRIHLQPELTPRSLMFACAEGLLGELIKNARLGFSDLATEEPLHHTVQLIASSRGYHHHHEYPVIVTKGQGDHKRLDFVFTKPLPDRRTNNKHANIGLAIALEMKVVGRRSKNFAQQKNEGLVSKPSPYRTVTKDIAKIKSFLTTTVEAQGIRESAGYLMIVNLDINSGISWNVKDAGGIREQDVSLLRRFWYSNGLIHKSVTIFEIHMNRDKTK